MLNKITQNEIVSQVEEELRIKIVEITTPPQGMDSDVFFARDSNRGEYAIKYSRSAISDVAAYKLLEENKIGVPVPKLLGNFSFKGKSVAILEKIVTPLLETISKKDMGKYIPSMIINLREIHKIRSNSAGSIINQNEKSSWRDIVIENFIGKNPSLNWEEVLKRKVLDSTLIRRSIDKIIDRIERTDFAEGSYSLLHTDFNQRNLFVNPNSNEITGIIDWGEAMFGDPIFDFARVRMYIWHFNLSKVVLDNYYNLLSFSKEEIELESLYWISRVIEYLAWYSEDLNDFNIGRIKLHQDFLRDYKW